jgi:hypothetical protein
VWSDTDHLYCFQRLSLDVTHFEVIVKMFTSIFLATACYYTCQTRPLEERRLSTDSLSEIKANYYTSPCPEVFRYIIHATICYFKRNCFYIYSNDLNIKIKSAFCPHSIYIFCVIRRKVAIISLNSINRLIFVMASQCVFRKTGINQITPPPHGFKVYT